MNWDDLRYFLAAVRQQTFSAAALELGVNRTTVARRITQLERRLGQALFEHKNRQYALTGFGHELYQHACALEANIESLEETLGVSERRLDGHLRIAAPLGLGPEFISELSTFSGRYPQIRWELLNTVDPVAALNERKAEVALAISNTCPGHIRGYHVHELSRALYASKRYLRRIPAETPLENHHWIGWGQELSDSLAARWMARELPEDIYKPAEVNSWNAILAAVKAGLGIAHLWCFLADHDKQIVAIRESTPELSMGLWIMRPSHIPPNPRVKAFIRSMQELLHKRFQEL